jgi:hypothetical protein
MIELLRSKGYEGEDSLEPIMNWLEDKGIIIQLDPVWEEDEEELLGYRAMAWINPYSSTFASPTMCSYRDALTSLLYNIKDYLCTESTCSEF